VTIITKSPISIDNDQKENAETVQCA